MKSQSDIYVSRVKGNDSKSCGSQDHPCFTISQAVSQAQFGSSIFLDSTKTSVSPYDCQPQQTSYHPGIYVNKALSFFGAPSLAHVSCRKGQNWIANGTDSSIQLNLTGISFQNSRFYLIETSVAVHQCVFSNTQTLVMNISVLHQNLTNLLFQSVCFEYNEACISVTSSYGNSRILLYINIDMNNVTFNSNGLRDTPILPSPSWIILGVRTAGKHLIDLQIKNSSLYNNYVRSSGMIYVKNQLGRINLLIKNVTFKNNGLKDSREQNSLFVLTSSVMSLVISQSQVKNSKQRLLSISSTTAEISVSHTTADDFQNPHLHGGMFWIESILMKLLFKNCSFSNGKFNPAHGGLLFVSARNIDLLIENSHLTKLTTMGFGGVVYATAKPSSGASMKLNIINCTFTLNKATAGGVIYAQTEGVINIQNSTFYNNTSTTGAGGAVYLGVGGESRVHIVDSNFEANSAMQSLGAGLAISTSGDALCQSGCKRAKWRAWKYNNSVDIIRTHFISNQAGRGGAVSMTDGSLNFTNCTFLNNIASDEGSHLINYGTNSLNLINCTFLQTFSKYWTPAFMIHTYSSGPLVLTSTTVDRRQTSGRPALIMVSKGGLVEFSDSTSIICPSGMDVSLLNLSYTDWINTSCSLDVTVLRLQCKQCDQGKYSLQRGHTKGLKVAFFSCLPCPYGAYCDFYTIEVMPNFWGYLVEKRPPTLRFTLCPDNYCLANQSNYWPHFGSYNSCNKKRSGFMCGHCEPGYSETLFSAECKRSQDCDDKWFWLVFLALIFVMASFLVFKPPVVTFVAKQAFWFKRARNVNETESLNEDEIDSTFLLSRGEIENENLQDVGYLEIIFYFYQISSLLLSSSSFKKLLETAVLIPLQGFFNFQERFFEHQSPVCPFPGLTPQTKKLLEVSPVFGTLGAIYFIYLIHYTLCKILRTATPKIGRYIEATMETILLGYIKIANVSLSLIRCVPIRSERRWFYNGTIVCYQWWQIVLIVLNVSVIVPSIIVLGWGAVKLYHGKVSAKNLLLACAFPLPFLTLWLLQRLGIYSNRNQHIQNNEYTEALKSVLLSPFREPTAEKAGALYWESVFIMRRFILVFIYCFITNTTWRLFCMSVVCVLVLLHHTEMKPFRNKRANIAESISLLGLVILSIINMYRSSSEASISDGMDTFEILNSIEIILLGLLPAVGGLVILLTVVSLITRVLFLIMIKLYRRMKNLVA